MLEVNKNLDKFVYHVSHDLRAPVASSLGLIELTRLEGDKSKISEYLDLQKKNLLRLDAFISNILKYSRNTRLAVKQDNITFQKLFDSLMNQHKYFEDALKVNFKVDINQEEVFINDEMRLDIILSNLISNAIKYSDPVKEENRITLEINANKNLAEIKITDNGIGIEEEYIERIFDPFFRATDYKHGSGIGLALVKEAVDKINGSILVCSKFKEGTTFTVSIPALK
ncbi:MAG: HAMP domain-containing sensor histidine kinase [Bacteroidota bacterium]